MRILVRAIGPGLKPFGVGGVLGDPQLEIYRGSERIAVNDNWSADPAGAASVLDATASVGAFALPAGSADSALVLSLPAGAYTAQVRGRDGTTGVALVEVYALPQ